MILEGEDARRFQEYMEDPTYTACGLILLHRAAIEAGSLSKKGIEEFQRRISILEKLDPHQEIRHSQFEEVFKA